MTNQVQNKVEHTCMYCGTRSTEVKHVEYGLYQCTDIDACMNTDIANGKMMQVDVADDDMPDWFESDNDFENEVCEECQAHAGVHMTWCSKHFSKKEEE